MTVKKRTEDLNTLSSGGEGIIQMMLEASFKESHLDPQTFMLVRMAALAAMDASPASWMMNLKVGKELGISEEDAMGTLVAIMPVIGTARVMSAAGNITKAMVMADEMKRSSKDKKSPRMTYH